MQFIVSLYGRVAQLVEQAVHTRRVGGSNPSSATFLFLQEFLQELFSTQVGILNAFKIFIHKI